MVVLTGCGTPKPSSDIVSRAIARQIAVPVASISEQLDTPVPQLAISGIAVKLIETMKMGKLPTYHLQGTYNLQLDLPSEQVQQQQNPFDIYLQRQIESKTWRLLRREGGEGEQWLSYSLYDRYSAFAPESGRRKPYITRVLIFVRHWKMS
ncbi:MAG: hypothetical protein GDA44_08100 [Prochloron sp. SP5CPC1]|nr:hypothetical protein [Candidatus Paraprochloron terpiosi SP5CPC1]